MEAIKVSELNAYIKQLLERDSLLTDLTVIGEVTGYKGSAGHNYFYLKDGAASIQAIIWANSLPPEIMDRLADGIEITARGRIGAYAPRGTYSFHIRQISLNKEGDLAKAFYELKAKLEKEGLFSTEKKKELPAFPKNIGIITAKTGAVIREMLSIIQQRNNIVSVYVFDSAVQGEGAAENLARQMRFANKNYPMLDALIIGRGGGSLEDLASFNDEGLARAIHESKIPVVSAVGHGADFSISDFVADVRAETPTDAVYITVPDASELRQEIDERMASIKNAIARRVKYYELAIKALSGKNLAAKCDMLKYGIDKNKESLINTIGNRLQNYMQNINLAKRTLDAKNPKGILKSGYAYLTDGGGRTVARVKEAEEAVSLTGHFYDGETTLR
jgi:exodeoxyribonuclease VII large subunit